MLDTRENASDSSRRMKKVIVVLVILAVLIGGAAWFLLSRYGVTDGARLTPADTVAFLSLPDVARTRERWKQTALARIAADPAVKAFLEKPLTLLDGEGGSEAAGILEELKPGRLFVAVPSVSENEVEVLVGFQYFGSKDDLKSAMDRMHAELQKQFPVATKSTSDYEGDEVTAMATPNGTLYSSSHSSWAFLALAEKTLHAALDRTADRATDGALVDDETFAEVMGNLAEDPEVRWFARPGPLVQEMKKYAEQSGGDVSSMQVEQIEKIDALGGSLIFDGLDQKERFFAFTPEEAHEYPKLDHSTIDLTTPNTTIYFASIQDWSAVAEPDYVESLPEEVQTFLTENDLDLAKVPEWLGGDSALSVTWGANAMVPNAILALSIRDRAAVNSLVDRVMAGMSLNLQSTEAGGARVIKLPEMEIQLVDPVIAISDDYLFLSLTEQELSRVLTAGGGDEKTLVDAGAFEPAKAAYDTPAQAFGYIDSKVIFERIYNQLRPVILIGAAMSPGASDVVDVSKLPETETISGYLRPVVYNQRQTEDGWLMESSGPITMTQGGLVLGGALAAAMLNGMAEPPAGP